ncbi:MAG: CheR family methyltransferase, partial [Gemmatimonadaceae bacterium]
SFFRDTAVFDKLEATIVPDLIRALPEGQALRVWVAGCSSGEEAYSIAMVCGEAITASGRPIKLQVFASDVDPDAVATAHEGFYPAEAAIRIGPARLARYFVKEELGYRVTATLRGDVVFTVQDVLSDPPFSRIDLVSCRNLLIYLNPEAQAKVIGLFHFALRAGGVLLLGASETVGAASDRFAVLAKSERFYRPIAPSRAGDLGFGQTVGAALLPQGSAAQAPLASRPVSLADLCSRAIMASHAPAAILIDHRRQCLYAVGPVDRYLRLAPGYATLDVLALATPVLRTRLRLAIDQVGKTGQPVAVARTRITHDNATIWFSCDVQALPAEPDDLVLICFLEEPERSAVTVVSGGERSRIAELETELAATQAELQLAFRNQEIASQDQKAINEEALSVNEEFQSTNEELLTSKEELQSLNEELNVLNSQLQETLERQRLTSDDLQNVLYSTNVGTLFLDLDLKIRFYTPAIKTVFSVIAGDVGRPLADLKPILADPALLTDARNVVADGITVEREIAGPNETWFLRRIFPYRAHTNRIEGVVITFADVTERNLAAKALEASKLEAERANLAKSRFLAAASHDLRQPMQSLTLLHELLIQTSDEDKRRKLLARVDSTLGAMSGMLNALLDIN